MGIVGLLLLIIGIFIGVLMVYLSIIIFLPVLFVLKQPLSIDNQSIETEKEQPEHRLDATFEINGTTLSGYLYLPENVSAPVPCIIMSHGFGGTKDMLLEAYAMRFVGAGMAAFTYDYRHFGKSGGKPRQLFSITSQLEDLKAAIDYVRQRNEIDPSRIALWGTSAAGGYGLIIAARDTNIACILGQCPALNSREDAKMALNREGIGFFLRLLVHAQRDKGRSRFGLAPHRIPVVGKPGTLAMITAPGAFEGYSQLAPPDFINEVCARVLLTTQGNNPIDYAKDVMCPVLLQVCEQDNLVSAKSYKDTAEILGKYAEVQLFPIGHFGIYTGTHFDKAVRAQIEFFKKNFGIQSV